MTPTDKFTETYLQPKTSGAAPLEARLMNGEITVRDFVNGLAKSPFYKDNYFHSVAPQRGIELNFKHLLGRAPLNQEEVQNSIKLQAEDGIRDLVRSRGLGDVYKRQGSNCPCRKEISLIR